MRSKRASWGSFYPRNRISNGPGVSIGEAVWVSSPIVIFIVTRYNKQVTKTLATRPKRGRPPTGEAMTAAERMRRYRARRRAAGLRAVTRFELPPRTTLSGIALDHRIIEARSLAMHCLAAKKIDEQSSLIDKVRRTLENWRRNYGQRPPRALNEWSDILSWPWPAIAAFITDAGERPTRLRQSSPFTVVLDPGERKRIYAAFRS